MSTKIPVSWVESSFSELNQFESSTIDPAQYPEESFELYSVPSFPTGKPEFLKGAAIGSTKQTVEPNDVLVCKINPRINRVWQVDVAKQYRQIASSEWIGFRSDVLHTKFYRHYFTCSDFRGLICTDVTGVGGSLTRAQPKKVATFPVPLAPLPEQKRIAAKLDAVLARVDACRDRLDRIPAILKRFRQSVLAAATSGKLTEEWRGEKAISNEWSQVQLGDVARDLSYGSSAKSSKSGDVPVLRMGNIQDGRLDWSDLVYTSDIKEVAKYQLAPGDVLFNRTNSPELVGKTAVFKGERESVYAGYLIRVRCLPQLLPDYLSYCLGSPAGRDYCWQVKSDGVSQSNINAKKLAAFDFLLPSVQEQTEIVRRVESLFAYADRLEARYITARAQVEKLTPASLAKAFRGELVPQDPNDEPASVLLARIAKLSPDKARKKSASKVC